MAHEVATVIRSSVRDLSVQPLFFGRSPIVFVHPVPADLAHVCERHALTGPSAFLDRANARCAIAVADTGSSGAPTIRGFSRSSTFARWNRSELGAMTTRWSLASRARKSLFAKAMALSNPVWVTARSTSSFLAGLRYLPCHESRPASKSGLAPLTSGCRSGSYRRTVRFRRGRWSGGLGRDRARFGRAPSRVHSSGSPGRGSGSGGCFGALPTASFAQWPRSGLGTLSSVQTRAM